MIARPMRSPRRRAVLGRAVATAALFALAGCGGTTDEAATTVTITQPAATAAGAPSALDLTGVRFEVHRDPG